MPKAVIGQWTSKNERFTKVLKSGLVREGKDYKNLIKRTGRCTSVIYTRYKKPETITVDELRVFIQEAKLTEDDILDFLFKDRGR